MRFLSSKVRFEKAECRTRGAVGALAARCPRQGQSQSSRALPNLSLFGAGEVQSMRVLLDVTPEEWGKGFGSLGVINYHRPVSVHWTAFVSQNNHESHKQKKFGTARVGSRREGCVSCRVFLGGRKWWWLLSIRFPFFLVPPAGKQFTGLLPIRYFDRVTG